MNKNDLVQALGSSVQEVDGILKAMRLKIKDADYKDGLIEKIKPILALMNEKQIDAKTAIAQLNGAIAKAESAEPTPVAMDGQIEFDQKVFSEDSVDQIGTVIRDSGKGTMDRIPGIVADRTAHLNKQVESTVHQLTDGIYRDLFSAAANDPGLAQKVREAIERKKSPQSSDKSG